MEEVVLVDKNDTEIGKEEKMKAHQEGKLHRAFSIFIFNKNGDTLLQKRNKKKYHSGGLWTNTCCSHPRPGEPIKKAAKRRLKEEMGFDAEIKEIFSFVYKVDFEKNLTEHEYDHVFAGLYEGKIIPNSEEVEDWKWINMAELRKNIDENPSAYTYWLKVSIDKIVSYLNDNPIIDS